MPPTSRQVRRALERAKRGGRAVAPIEESRTDQSGIAGVGRWGLFWIGGCVVAGVVLGTTIGPRILHAGDSAVAAEPSIQQTSEDGWPTLEAMAAMNDEQLAKVDPIVMNLVVARGFPGWEKLDIAKYVKQVDAWAAKIDQASNAAEPYERNTELYKHSAKLWRAGGMAIMLAGGVGNIHYTTENLDTANPEQYYVNGLIDKRLGTCSSMPVLYLGVAHRLGWPMHAAVSKDHMWTRWDEGEPGQNDGKEYFNLEATSADSKDGMGSFNSLTDEQIAEWLETPRERIDNGSDFGSLTPRQTLAVYLQPRMAYWMGKGRPDKALKDATIAVKLFPENYDIVMQAQEVFLVATGGGSRRGGGMSPSGFGRVDRVAREADERRRKQERQEEEAERIRRLNEENQRRMFPQQPGSPTPGQPQNPSPYNPFPGGTP